MWKVFFVLLLVVSFCGGEVEIIGGPVRELKPAVSANLRIYIDYQFQKHGKIHRWSYYAQRSGTFYASVWRPVKPETRASQSIAGEDVIRWELINSTKIRAMTPGHHDFFIPFPDRIAVRPGDAIAIYYSRGYAGNATVVSEFQGAKQDIHLDSIPLSKVSAHPVRDGALIIGKTGFRRKILERQYATSLTAHTMSAEDIIRFVAGTHYSWNIGGDRIAETGVIEVKVKGIWGTICETRGMDSSMPAATRIASVAYVWGNRLCKLLNTDYVMGYVKTVTGSTRRAPVLRNPLCPDDYPLESCNSDVTSLQTNPCLAGQAQMISCLPDPTKFAIKMGSLLAAKSAH